MKLILRNAILLYLLFVLFFFIYKPSLININAPTNSNIKTIIPILFVIISVICYYVMAIISD